MGTGAIEALDTTTPGGRLVLHVFAALAEFIRELIVEGTREGMDAARGPQQSRRRGAGRRPDLEPAVTHSPCRRVLWSRCC